MSQTLDEAWFSRYRAIADRIGETYEMLEPSSENLEQKRQEFVESGFKKNISLLSDRVSLDACTSARRDLEQLRSDIIAHETNAIVRKAYLDAIALSDTNAQIILAGTQPNSAAFAAANALLYDQPDTGVFEAACNWIRQDAEKTLPIGGKQTTQLAERVLELVPDIGNNHDILIPSESVFREIRQLHRQPGGYYDHLFGTEGVPSEPYIDQLEGDEICRRVLRNIGSDFTIADSENNLWAVLPSRKQLVRPVGYRLDRDEFIGTVCHEIGSHIIEYVNGCNQPLQLLGSGLAGFDKGNEGRAFLREQIVYANERSFLEQFAWEYIVLLHFSVSLAAGAYERPYTFAELYEVLFALYACWRERRLPFATNNEAFAHTEAWYLTVRVMKGTEGLGGAYMKDTVYLEGNIRCWQAAAKDPSIILLGDQGKFDITNPNHLAIFHAIQKS